jgi:hypothetical protein
MIREEKFSGVVYSIIIGRIIAMLRMLEFIADGGQPAAHR